MKLRRIIDAETLITRRQAAELLGFTNETLAKWKCTKKYPLPCVKIGKNIRYRLSDVLEFIKNNTQE